MSFCKLKFEVKSLIMPYSGLYPIALATSDFNNDGKLDVVFFSQANNSLFMLPGNGNGTFRALIRSRLSYTSISLERIAVGDFNLDNKLDIAFTDSYATSMSVLFGSGNGTFGNLRRFSTGSASYPYGIAIGYINHDNYSDIVIADRMYDKLTIYLGNRSGNFSAQQVLSTGKETAPYSISVIDVNDDNHSDIIVINYYDRNIGIFLGYGNGTFDEQKTFFTGGGIYPCYMTLDDLNNDSKQDIVFSTTGKTIGIMYGYGNGSFREKIKYKAESIETISPVIIKDFNNDGHLDIIYGQIGPYGVGLLVGDGNENFHVQTIFSTTFQGEVTEIIVGDFNTDGYQDIIAADSASGSMNLLLNAGVCNTTQNSIETSTSIH